MICEKCKNNIPDTAKFCPKCGAKIEISERPTEPEKLQDVIICLRCGAENPLTARFCRKDGTPLKEEAKPPETIKKEIKPEKIIERELKEVAPIKTRKTPLRIAISILIIILIVVGSYLYFSGRISKKPEEVNITHLSELPKPLNVPSPEEELKPLHYIAYDSDDTYCNIRSGPGVNYNIIATLPNGEKIQPTGKEHLNWKEIILLDGRIGWIHKDIVRRIDTNEVSRTTPSWGVISGSNVILRSSYSTSADIVARLNRGDKVKIIQRRRSEVFNEGVTTRDENIITATTNIPVGRGKAVKILGQEGSYFIVSCNIQGREVTGKIPSDAVEKTFGEIWYQVKTAQEEEGWVYGAFLRELTE